MPAPAEHVWHTHPQAAELVNGHVRSVLDRIPYARRFADRLLTETGTRLVDWLSNIKVPCRGSEQAYAPRFAAAGFVRGNDPIWSHPGGLFPDILEVVDGPAVVMRVESVADFVAANGLADETANGMGFGTEGYGRIRGEPLGAIRRVCVAAGGGDDEGRDVAEFWVEERHGVPVSGSRIDDPYLVLEHAEAFRLRRRGFADDAAGFDHARHLFREAATDVGVDRACDLFFAAEREYWQRRNRAARVQKARQDALGLGWGNHDHHTYRSSREHFARLIAALEEMGFVCRERFYAGRAAGWGAQVLEQPIAGVVVFADVDLSPDEVAGDFAHDPLPPRDALGTVGLWCRLHGEAFLQAGMHHLECRFAFDAARDQLKACGVEAMKPFTDFPHLRQAFTRGEPWPVAADRVDRLERDGLVTAEQAATFRAAGAVGSHLEILQRDDGYKGFNQTGVDDIIRRTDPRGGG